MSEEKRERLVDEIIVDLAKQGFADKSFYHIVFEAIESFEKKEIDAYLASADSFLNSKKNEK